MEIISTIFPSWGIIVGFGKQVAWNSPNPRRQVLATLNQSACGLFAGNLLVAGDPPLWHTPAIYLLYNGFKVCNRTQKYNSRRVSMKRTVLLICTFVLLIDLAADGQLGKVRFVAPCSPVKSLNTAPDHHKLGQVESHVGIPPPNFLSAPRRPIRQTATQLVQTIHFCLRWPRFLYNLRKNA
jgi:hypothetical protein